jgi:hypothetical protein
MYTAIRKLPEGLHWEVNIVDIVFSFHSFTMRSAFMCVTLRGTCEGRPIYLANDVHGSSTSTSTGDGLRFRPEINWCYADGHCGPTLQ